MCFCHKTLLHFWAVIECSKTNHNFLISQLKYMISVEISDFLTWAAVVPSPSSILCTIIFPPTPTPACSIPSTHSYLNLKSSKWRVHTREHLLTAGSSWKLEEMFSQLFKSHPLLVHLHSIKDLCTKKNFVRTKNAVTDNWSEKQGAKLKSQECASNHLHEAFFVFNHNKIIIYDITKVL